MQILADDREWKYSDPVAPREGDGVRRSMARADWDAAGGHASTGGLMKLMRRLISLSISMLIGVGAAAHGGYIAIPVGTTTAQPGQIQTVQVQKRIVPAQQAPVPGQPAR